jgi:disulfide bond formation protein DsbB
LILLAAGGSAALLLGAFGFQLLGYAPCHLCLLQRWPHAAAILIGGVALVFRGWLWPLLGALAAATTAGLGLYHTGVEQQWWQGPTTCTSGGVGSLTPDQLLAQINAAPLVQCDQIAWQMFGLSMASWNMLLSAALALVWLMAAARSRAVA